MDDDAGHLETKPEFGCVEWKAMRMKKTRKPKKPKNKKKEA
jgi:hypothetical protein